MGSLRDLENNVGEELERKNDDEIIMKKKKNAQIFRILLVNFQEVILGTKLCLLLPAIPLAILAQYYHFARPWIFAFSLLGLAPLAERVSFLTEQIAHFTGPTVGGLLNATCGNATEMIIGLFALYQRKIHVLKYSLLGSILSNLLLVLGSSLFCGGLANIKKEQRFDRKQADVNSLLLLLGLLCHMLPLMYRLALGPSINNINNNVATSILGLSRVSSIGMLIAYAAYLFFQLKTHRQFFESPEEEEEENKASEDEEAVIGFWSSFAWLIGMTITIALLSEYVVGTIEAASDSWGISVSFISLIVLPIVGNAAEHAGSIIFALKNKLVPLCVIMGWIIGVDMDLDFSILETGSLAFSIILIAFTLQDGTSHYMKGAILCLAYCAIGACFFFHKIPINIENYSYGIMSA
ncbi:hypothetical protein MTR67_025447 [Solanum verrucosum]|uniref:Vacuolar cation/proton exchanger n=1 Tax=Solanum verrucosum TaxID=315347 RepID=A0AAF0TT43_SOLVR|nr:hypothetical protein MTR67_025447 [Solanum verrucosum]